MIDLPAILRRLDVERRSLVIHGQSLEILPHVSRVASADGSHHQVISSSLTSQTADAVIAQEAAHYRAMKIEVEWKLYRHDSPADLSERLTNHGFMPGPCEAVLVLDLLDRPNVQDKSPGHKVIRVENADQVHLFRTAAEQIFAKEYAFTANELLANIQRESTHHLGYIAMDGDIPVSIGRLYTHPHSVFGGLYGGGTLESHRGRGFYRAVVAERAQEALRLGARYLIVDALPTSRPILEKLGFIHLTDTWPCELKP